MTSFFGRRLLLDRIHELHRSSQHVSVVGARAIGKTALLQAVVARHVKGSDVFAGAGIVDLRHDPPASMDAALRRVASTLRDVFRTAARGELSYLAGEVRLDVSATEIYDQLKIALDMVADSTHRLLLVLDGCDPVLQNSSIPRNLWDNLRALGQTKSLRLMTGSRDQLHRLCYNPEARTSDFFRIFYDEPQVVGPFDGSDWKALYEGCGIKLDGSAEREFVNWTGGHPDLVDLLLGRLREIVKNGTASKQEIDEAAESLVARGSARLDALWMDCPEDSRGDIVQLIDGEMWAADLPSDRRRYLIERGIVTESGKKVRLANRFIKRVAGSRKFDVSGARRLFERPEDFATNIRTVIELRLAQVQGGDPELMKLVRRATKHLPDEPDATLGTARDIFDRAIKLVWEVEAPGGIVPKRWIDHWRDTEVVTGRAIRAAADYARDPTIPEARGMQCALLKTATGEARILRIASKVSKSTYALIEHTNQVGDLKNHTQSDPSVTMAVAFCMAAIELVETLARELKP
jgi:hypothetical protein